MMEQCSQMGACLSLSHTPQCDPIRRKKQKTQRLTEYPFDRNCKYGILVKQFGEFKYTEVRHLVVVGHV